MRVTNCHLLSLSLALLCAISAQAQPIVNSSQYQTCTELARTDPSKALLMADDWSRKENTASAHHCRAISLFALKRYSDAGEALERLSFMITQSNLMLWSNVLRQSAKAWELDGDKARAIVVLTKAILPTAEEGLENPTFGRLAAELLLARSELYQKAGRTLYAIQDLDQGLMLSPTHHKLLLARASLFVQQKETTLAKQDLEMVLQQQPDNPEAQMMLSRIR